MLDKLQSVKVVVAGLLGMGAIFVCLNPQLVENPEMIMENSVSRGLVIITSGIAGYGALTSEGRRLAGGGK